VTRPNLEKLEVVPNNRSPKREAKHCESKKDTTRAGRIKKTITVGTGKTKDEQKKGEKPLNPGTLTKIENQTQFAHTNEWG